MLLNRKNLCILFTFIILFISGHAELEDEFLERPLVNSFFDDHSSDHLLLPLRGHILETVEPFHGVTQPLIVEEDVVFDDLQRNSPFFFDDGVDRFE